MQASLDSTFTSVGLELVNSQIVLKNRELAEQCLTNQSCPPFLRELVQKILISLKEKETSPSSSRLQKRTHLKISGQDLFKDAITQEDPVAGCPTIFQEELEKHTRSSLPKTFFKTVLVASFSIPLGLLSLSVYDSANSNNLFAAGLKAVATGSIAALLQLGLTAFNEENEKFREEMKKYLEAHPEASFTQAKEIVNYLINQERERAEEGLQREEGERLEHSRESSALE